MIDKLAQLDQQNVVADQQTLLENQLSPLIEKLGMVQSHVEILIAQRERTDPE
jgi:hypothetical protein